MEDCIYNGFCDIECKQTCMKYLEMRYLLKSSGIPKNKQKINKLIPDACDIKAFEKLSEIRDNIQDFVKEGNSIYLYSSHCGNGKTTWSIKLMLQYFNEVWLANGFKRRGIFINVPTFLTMCKASISMGPNLEFDRLRTDLPNVDLVVFDDIASTRLSEYDYNTLLTFIDQRVINCKSNIFTGNIMPDKLADYIGERLSSRVCGNSCVKILLRGSDLR